MLVRNSDFGDYDGLWSAVKRLGRNIDITNRKGTLGNWAKTTVGKIVLAPLALPFAQAKMTTWVMRKAGLPVKKLDSKLHRVNTQSPIKGLLETNAVIAATAAAVAGSVFTGGGSLAILAAAAPGTSLLARNKATYKGALAAGVTGLAAGLSVTGIESLADSLSSSMKNQKAFQSAITKSPTPVGPTEALPAATKGASGAVGPLAGVGLGFVAGGPIGALVGGILGAVLGRKKS